MILALRCRGPSAGPLYATTTPLNVNPNAAPAGCAPNPAMNLHGPDCACCNSENNKLRVAVA